MKQPILTLFIIFSMPIQAVIHPILNPDMRERGVCLETLEKWLAPQSREQGYPGQFYADLLSPRLFENGQFKGNCLKLEEIEKHPKAVARIFLLYVNPNCLAPNVASNYRLKFAIKVHDPYDLDEESLLYINQLENENIELATKSYQDKILRQNGFPVLAVPEGLFKVERMSGDIEHLSVFHAAKGYSLFDIIFTYIQDKQRYSFDYDHIRATFAAFGEKLGNMHNFFMDKKTIYQGDVLPEDDPVKSFKARDEFYKTRTHGDLHGPNVFYDAKRQRLTFIDYESMALSIKRQGLSIQHDLETIIFRPFLHGRLLENINYELRDRLMSAFTAFLRPYICSFPENQIPNLIRYMQNFLRFHLMTRCLDKPSNFTLHRLREKEHHLLSIIREELIDELNFIGLNYGNQKMLRLHQLSTKYNFPERLAEKKAARAELKDISLFKSAEDAVKEEMESHPNPSDTQSNSRFGVGDKR